MRALGAGRPAPGCLPPHSPASLPTAFNPLPPCPLVSTHPPPHAPKGVALHRLLARRVRSLLLTSGTLAPLDAFAAELQLGFRHTLENPHIVEPHQAR